MKRKQMNKAELISKVATELETSKANAEAVITTVIGSIIEGAKEGECVIPGLGKLVTAETSARSGVTNGVQWSKPAGKTLKLRLSKAGKEIL